MTFYENTIIARQDLAVNELKKKFYVLEQRQEQNYHLD